VEAWYHPSTASCSTSFSGGNTDGFIKLWVNGQLIVQQVNVNLQGVFGTGGASPTMQATMTNLEAGGVITAWASADHTQRCNRLPCAIDPNLTAFHRYIDDIIVLKK
jgi:hypothetical protein